MRLLLVEDDLPIGQSLLRALTDAGYGVEWVRDGVSGRAAIDAGEYTVVLLDLNLPGMNGLEVLRSARASGKEVPLLILTARDNVESRVHGLDLGAPTIMFSNRLRFQNSSPESAPYSGERLAMRHRGSATTPSVSISTNARSVATASSRL
jgi:CheY-like chemotaxis protein